MARSAPAFGKWNTVFKRFRDWVKADVFKRTFDAMSDDPDMEYAMVGMCLEALSTNAKAHQWRANSVSLRSNCWLRGPDLN